MNVARTEGTAAALRIWRARTTKNHRDRLYELYVTLFAAVIVGAPLARSAWIATTSPAGTTMLRTGAVPLSVSLVTGGLWVLALALGGTVGPVRFPPFLTTALACGPASASRALRRPFLISLGAVSGVTTGVAGFVGAASVATNSAPPLAAFVFAGAALSAGVIATVLWLIGQAFPAPARFAALLLLVGVALGTLGNPRIITASTPWGWMAAAAPGPPTLPHAVYGILALALLGLALTPRVLNALRPSALITDAARRDTALAHGYSFDFGAMTETFRSGPRRGRSLRAVHPRLPLPALFLVRDAVGSWRSPARCAAGIACSLLASGCLTAALVSAPHLGAGSRIILGAIAGLLAFRATALLGDGITHAARVAGDRPLYGVSDARLVAYHSLFPLAVTLVSSTGGAAVARVLADRSGLVVDGTVNGTAVSALTAVLALGTLATRVARALKGALPTVLLTPISSPAGDPGVIFRLAWAFDDTLLAAAFGACLAVVVISPLPLVAALVVLAGIVGKRWRDRS